MWVRSEALATADTRQAYFRTRIPPPACTSFRAHARERVFMRADHRTRLDSAYASRKTQESPVVLSQTDRLQRRGEQGYEKPRILITTPSSTWSSFYHVVTPALRGWSKTLALDASRPLSAYHPTAMIARAVRSVELSTVHCGQQRHF